VKIYAFARVFFDLEEFHEFFLEQDDLKLELYVVSTVESKTKDLIEEFQKRYKIQKIDIFNSETQLEIKDLYQGIGQDRVAKLLGVARLKPGKNIILMDFGTATTISVLDKDKVFKGGFIALGMRSSLKALAEYCDALADYSEDEELGVLIDNYDVRSIYEHKSTKRAILLGAINSQMALINQWIFRARQFLVEDTELLTVCTGGEAGYFEKYFDLRVEDEDLLKLAFTS
jgi:type III pantothenate kinase